MNTFLILLLLVGVISARVAKEGEAPYQASIRTERGHMCSGAILNQEWIVTSASCVIRIINREKQYVVVGTHDVTAPGTSFPVNIVWIHTDYIRYKYDIAVVQVNGTIQFNDKIKPIQLPERSTKTGAHMLISGWKRVTDPQQSNNLQLRNVTSISTEQCEKELGPHMELYKMCGIDDLPYGNGEEFFDDRGCPVVEGNRLAAVVSIPLRNNKPGVYTRVYELLEWLILTIYPDAQNTNL